MVKHHSQRYLLVQFCVLCSYFQTALAWNRVCESNALRNDDKKIQKRANEHKTTPVPATPSQIRSIDSPWWFLPGKQQDFWSTRHFHFKTFGIQKCTFFGSDLFYGDQLSPYWLSPTTKTRGLMCRSSRIEWRKERAIFPVFWRRESVRQWAGAGLTKIKPDRWRVNTCTV